MNSGVLHAACDVSDTLTALGYAHCFIGGLAVLHWGEARFTADIDVSIYTGFSSDQEVISRLVEIFEPRNAEAAVFAAKHRTLLLKHPNGTPLDVVLAGLPYEAQVIERGLLFELLPNRFIRTCDANDLVVFKVFAGREKDWLDVDGIVARSGKNLDWAHIETSLTPLLELTENIDHLARLRAIRAKHV